MISPEYGFGRNAQSELFHERLGIDRESVKTIRDYFRRKLRKGFTEMFLSQGESYKVVNILPSLDVAGDTIFFEEQPDEDILTVPASRLAAITTVMNLVSARFIDKDRIGDGPKTNLHTVLDDGPKSLDCNTTCLPVIFNIHRFNLIARKYSVLQTIGVEKQKRVICVNYTLHSPDK